VYMQYMVYNCVYYCDTSRVKEVRRFDMSKQSPVYVCGFMGLIGVYKMKVLIYGIEEVGLNKV
jgi:hypothetical protein